MPRSRGFPQVRSRSQRRKTGWVDGPGQTAAQTAISATGALLFASGISPTEDNFTLARLRGRLKLFLSAGTTVLSGFAGAFGIGIVNQPAFAIGVTAVPTPTTERSWDGWIYWTPFSLKVLNPITSVDGQFSGEGMVLDIEVDTKAMRKLTSESLIYAALEVEEVGAAVLQSQFDSRMLWMAP